MTIPTRARQDPGGYVYNTYTNVRIWGATIWLQIPDGSGGWINAPTGQSPAIMQPDTNPLISDNNGQYQWNTLPGSYRIHVEKEGYFSADSLSIDVPPTVFDLNVGLDPMPPTASFTKSKSTAEAGGAITFDPSTSTHLAGVVVKYEWDWTSDGTYDQTQTSETITTHTYSLPGIYTITLRMTVDSGFTDTFSDTVTVVPAMAVPEYPLGTVSG